MLERSFDADRVNEIVNHPSVRPFIGHADGGDLDLAPLVHRDEHWFLIGEHGGFMLGWSAPNTREWHTFILPEGRGAWAAKARAEAVEYARANGTRLLWSKIPPASPHVERFARQGGMKPTDIVLDTFDKLYKVYCMELI